MEHHKINTGMKHRIDHDKLWLFQGGIIMGLLALIETKQPLFAALML